MVDKFDCKKLTGMSCLQKMKDNFIYKLIMMWLDSCHEWVVGKLRRKRSSKIKKIMHLSGGVATLRRTIKCAD